MDKTCDECIHSYGESYGSCNLVCEVRRCLVSFDDSCYSFEKTKTNDSVVGGCIMD